MMSRTAPILPAALAGCIAACSVTTGLDDLGSGGASSSATGAGGQGTTSAGTGPGGSGAGTGTGGSATAGNASTGVGAGSATCPVQGGAMIQLPKPSSGWFCIDRTEVTESAYQAFLSLNPSMADQPAECAGNTTYAPTCPFDPANAPNLPVVCIDWCDAYAFCKAVGKRLCGNIAGGSNPTSVSTDASMSAWYAACSRAGVRAFPYGDVYDPMACNGGDASVLSPANVATFPGCIGGYPDLYDMSGNVREWEDSCSGDLCMLRGGGWSDTASTSPHSLRCDSSGLVPRTTEDPATGFRCCADLP